MPGHGLGPDAVDGAHVAVHVPPETQEGSGPTPTRSASSVVDTTGDVVPVEGGYRWTGRGFFSSGVDHCNWLTAAVPIKREGVEGQPDRRWMLIPREDIEIIDDWYTVGLKGTGSKTIIVDDAFVPERRSLANLHSRTVVRRAADQRPSDVRRDLLSQLHRGDGGAGRRSARGFLEAFEQRLRTKSAPSTTADDQMARYAQAVAQVDAVHAVTLQKPALVV